MLRQAGPLREVRKKSSWLLRCKALTLRLLMTANSRVALMNETFALIVRFIQHHYVAVLTRAHSHTTSVSVSQILVK